MVQTQVTAQGWLGSTPEGRRPQIRGWRAGGSLPVASSTPATPLLSPAKVRELNPASLPIPRRLGEGLLYRLSERRTIVPDVSWFHTLFTQRSLSRENASGPHSVLWKHRS